MRAVAVGRWRVSDPYTHSLFNHDLSSYTQDNVDAPTVTS
jgi:hypothetical protein